MYVHKCRGTCSKEIHIEVENGVISDVEIIGGCRGNTKGVARLAVGRRPDEVIELLRGIPCQGATSCPDQLAQGLEEMKAQGLY